MTLTDRIYPDRVTPGTATTRRTRTRILLELYRVGGVPRWVELCLRAQLRPGIVGGVAR